MDSCKAIKSWPLSQQVILRHAWFEKPHKSLSHTSSFLTCNNRKYNICKIRYSLLMIWPCWFIEFKIYRTICKLAETRAPCLVGVHCWRNHIVSRPCAFKKLSRDTAANRNASHISEQSAHDRAPNWTILTSKLYSLILIDYKCV